MTKSGNRAMCLHIARVTLVVLALAFAVSLAGAPPADAGAGSTGFEERGLGAFPGRLMFDLGAVDVEGDGDLDLFSTNHNDRQGLLVNDGEGQFEDRLSQLGLDQQPRFPGLEVPTPPDMSENGVYVFRSGGTDPVEGSLTVAIEAAPGEEVTGTVEFVFPVAIKDAHGAEVTTEVDASRAPVRHVARFSAEGDARIVLEPEQMAAPVEVGIEAGYPLSAIRVGSLAIRPPAHRFTLHLRDRHGIAWGDYDRDGHMDAFIARGGLKGQIASFPGLLSDELMLGDGSSFGDAITSSGLVKGRCRARDTQPVDYNRDGLLDLFIGCQGAAPTLYRQEPDGTFSNLSHRLTGKKVSGDHFTWLDVNGNGRDELLAAQNSKLVTYRRSRKGRWSREPVRTFGEAIDRVVVADYDDDGDPDVFAPSPTGNTLLVNRSGHFRARNPARFGLPRGGSFTAAWVDYDNDGRTDLHTTPQGLFHRIGARRFAPTGLASTGSTALDALATWFDFNGDGSRDALLAAATPPTSLVWRGRLLENLQHTNHWLEVELTGPSGEYPAAGARVRVRADGRTQTQWVGQNDGSRHSQGHYRLYFGLGGATEARRVKVIWPDGSKSKLEHVAADRLLRLSFDRP